MNNRVTVDNDGEVLTHIPGVVHDYATLCGLDGNDPVVGQRTIPTPRGAKIDCHQCRAMWERCREVGKREFEQENP